MDDFFNSLLAITIRSALHLIAAAPAPPPGALRSSRRRGWPRQPSVNVSAIARGMRNLWESARPPQRARPKGARAECPERNSGSGDGSGSGTGDGGPVAPVDAPLPAPSRPRRERCASDAGDVRPGSSRRWCWMAPITGPRLPAYVEQFLARHSHRRGRPRQRGGASESVGSMSSLSRAFFRLTIIARLVYSRCQLSYPHNIIVCHSISPKCPPLFALSSNTSLASGSSATTLDLLPLSRGHIVRAHRIRIDIRRALWYRCRGDRILIYV